MNVRLTDERHAELVDAAHENRRSLAAEIQARLFDASDAEPRPVAKRKRTADTPCAASHRKGWKCKTCGWYEP